MNNAPTLVEEKMDQLIRDWEAAGDRRMIFLSCYRLMTRNMFHALSQAEFLDQAWVEELLNHFADYYFNALEAYELQNTNTPAAWQVAFDSAGKSDLSVLQHLLLGVNAHINYDLIFTTVDLLEHEWVGLSSEESTRRRLDYDRVNDIIQQTIDEVQDTIIERGDPRLEMLDRFMGPLDEWLISRLIERWRSDVWENAVSLLNATDAGEREKMRQQREAEVIELAQTILLQWRNDTT